MMSSYKLLILTTSLSAAVWLQLWKQNCCLPGVLCSVWYSSITIACMGLYGVYG